MSEQTPSYRRRNIALAVIAGVIVIGALVRMVSTTQQQQPTAQPAERATAAPASQPHDPTGSPIEVEVDYTGAVQALPETAKLYVFVRPVGERMPLGVQTFDIHELPVSVAFTPAAGAAEGKHVEVVARLSMSGEVSLQPGDLESVSAPLQFGAPAQRVQLTLGAGATGAATPSTPVATDATPGAARIGVHVSLGEAVHLPATTTVFLIVRPANGSPMPLAVKRFALSDLPTDVTLSDADAMMPGRTISGAGSVEIIARASVSGNVKAESGDYEARSGVLDVAQTTAPVVLVIAQPI